MFSVLAAIVPAVTSLAVAAWYLIDYRAQNKERRTMLHVQKLYGPKQMALVKRMTSEVGYDGAQYNVDKQALDEEEREYMRTLGADPSSATHAAHQANSLPGVSVNEVRRQWALIISGVLGIVFLALSAVFP